MNVRRIVVLGIAAVAAGAAALLARNMLGGGTPDASAQANLQAVDVMVASTDVDPGRALDAGNVRWQPWPKDSISASLITRDLHPDGINSIAGAVVRAPLLAGEPITENKIVHIGKSGFMAAVISPGKRAVSIPISVKTGAGGFILPNDRVDVMLTRPLGRTGKMFQVETVLRDVRVLAIDQTYKDEKDKQTVIGDTATLELTPEQSELIALAQAQGTLALALRGLAENASEKLAQEGEVWGQRGGSVRVIRYGVAQSSTPSLGGARP
ncbi:MAG: Flp pilus assembly protein CpaB [Alphaproteobacteria bacterium]